MFFKQTLKNLKSAYSDVAVLGVSSVSNNLGSAIGQGHPVFSADHTVVVLVLGLAEGGARVGIVHTILKFG